MKTSSDPVIIREIQAQDTYDLRHRVMWPDKPLAFVKLVNDDCGLHYGLFKGAIMISVVSLFIDDRIGQFRKLATEVSEQRNGYGTLLLEHIMKVAQDKKVEKMWCNARVDKTAYYESFGLEQTSQRFTKAEINYVVMERIMMPE